VIKALSHPGQAAASRNYSVRGRALLRTGFGERAARRHSDPAVRGVPNVEAIDPQARGQGRRDRSCG
jgi:hypothetical protein